MQVLFSQLSDELVARWQASQADDDSFEEEEELGLDLEGGLLAVRVVGRDF